MAKMDDDLSYALGLIEDKGRQVAMTYDLYNPEELTLNVRVPPFSVSVLANGSQPYEALEEIMRNLKNRLFHQIRAEMPTLAEAWNNGKSAQGTANYLQEYGEAFGRVNLAVSKDDQPGD